MFAILNRDIKLLLDEMSQCYNFTPYDFKLSSIRLGIACLWAWMGQQESLSS